MNKTIFSIHLMQDEHGHISVLAEAVGSQPQVHEIGIEIMANLETAAICNPHMNMRVQPLTFSDSLQ